MSIKLTYTTEDGATFDDSNQAKIHDAVKKTGVYLETYKMKELVEELHKILVVEYRTDLEKAKKDMDMYKRAAEAKTPAEISVRSGIGVHHTENYFTRLQEDKVPVESIITKAAYEGLGFPSVRG